MKINIELEEQDFKSLSEVIEKATNRVPDEDEALKYWDELPHDVKSLAVAGHHGCSSSEFMDAMYNHLLEGKQENATWS
jgi:hypothetical protein